MLHHKVQQQHLQHHTSNVALAQPNRRRSRLVAYASEGGLFGGLFGGNQSGQQQQQQQQQERQQPALQQTSAVQAAMPGTVENPEFPPYRVLQKGAAYDLRFYEVYPVVEMEYQRREEGYLALGSYQGGGNSSKSRYGHTQPVVMCYNPDGRKVMQMMVGAPMGQQQQQQEASGSSKADSIKALPAPTEPAVRLAVAGGEIVAVMPFEGYITPEAAAAVRQKLVNALQADGLSLAAEEADGFFRVAQYGQVYTLQTRLNEMMLKVQL